MRVRSKKIKFFWPFVRPYKRILPQNMLTFLWFCVRSHKFSFLLMLCFGLMWSIYVSAMPYAIKIIVDAVIDNAGSEEDLLDVVMLPCVAFIALYLLVNIGYRLRDFVFLKTVPDVQKKVWKRMSSYLKRHSHRYFQENMAGNLSNKVSDAVRGIAVILEMSETFFMQFVAISIATVIMYSVHPYFALVLAGWTILFLSSTIMLSRSSHHHSKLFSEARSSLAGRLVDVIQNITSMRIFARNSYEEQYMDRYLDRTKKKDQKLQLYMLRARVVQAIITAGLIAGMVVLLVYTRRQPHNKENYYHSMQQTGLNIRTHIHILTPRSRNFCNKTNLCHRYNQRNN